MSESRKGHSTSEETRKKIGNANRGKINHMKGKKQDTVRCPHCDKVGGIPGMKRYHFDNCRIM